MINDYADLIAEATEFTGYSGLPNRAAQFTVDAEHHIKNVLRIGINSLFPELPTILEAQTNWLLEDRPEIYLHAVSYMALRHIKDVEQATVVKSLLDDELARYQHEQKLFVAHNSDWRKTRVPL